MTVHHLSRGEARRIAVQAQRLDATYGTSAGGSGSVVEMVRHLTLVQVDATSAIAPSADIVLWSRLGSSYRPVELETALAQQSLLEHLGMIRPYEDLALFRAAMAEWPGGGEELRPWQHYAQRWVEANEACRQDILERLTADGPLPATELPDTCVLPWRSTGWTNHKNVNQLLFYMTQRGEVAVAGRAGRERLFDLGSRVYPDDPGLSSEQARRVRDGRRLHCLGIARSRCDSCAAEPPGVNEAGEPAVVEGVRGMWRVDPEYLDRPFEGRAVLLSPLDRLVYNRKRMAELFQFDYQLEMYKPAAKRRWGYYALPILVGDRLVGKLDAAADRHAGILEVFALHEDVPFSKKTRSAVDHEIEDLAECLGLAVSWP